MKSKNPGEGRGFALVLKGFVACETFLHMAGRAVKHDLGRGDA